jgi:uncharacterized protein YaiI (UPF0178 family)
MKIWVDADACPNVIKDVLFRAAERSGVQVTLVANQPVRIPPSRFIHFLQVPAGFDAADARILEAVEAGDLVVTADIPLAAEVIRKRGQVLDPRGEPHTAGDIGEKLALRKFMEDMRSSGVEAGGPPPLGNAERQAFARRLESLLAGRSAGGNPADVES